MGNRIKKRARLAVAVELVKYNNEKRNSRELREILVKDPYNVEVKNLIPYLRCNWFDVSKENNLTMVQIKPELYEAAYQHYGKTRKEQPELDKAIRFMTLGLAYYTIENLLGEP